MIRKKNTLRRMTEGFSLIHGRAFYSPRTKQKHIGDIPAMYSVVVFMRSPPVVLFGVIIAHAGGFVNGAGWAFGENWVLTFPDRCDIIRAIEDGCHWSWRSFPMIYSRGIAALMLQGGYFFFIIMSMIPKITTTSRFSSASTSKIVMSSPPLGRTTCRLSIAALL